MSQDVTRSEDSPKETQHKQQHISKYTVPLSFKKEKK